MSRFAITAAFSCALLLGGAGDGSAQVLPVPAAERQLFAFVGKDLTVHVQADVPGSLQLLRGEPGRIEAAGRAPAGFVGAGLARVPRHQLNLTAVGADDVDYLVVVPAGVRVRLRLPDRDLAEVFGVLQDAASYSWGTTVAPAPQP